MQLQLVEKVLQVNFYQKHSFLPQLTHNMTRDCLLNDMKNTSFENVVYQNCFCFDIHLNNCHKNIISVKDSNCKSSYLNKISKFEQTKIIFFSLCLIFHLNWTCHHKIFIKNHFYIYIWRYVRLQKIKKLIVSSLEHLPKFYFQKRTVANTVKLRAVDWSIIQFGQRSQYISIKFPLHKPSESMYQVLDCCN